MRVFLGRILTDQSGATAIEYAMMAALIGVVITGAVTALGTGVRTTLFGAIAGAFPAG